MSVTVWFSCCFQSWVIDGYFSKSQVVHGGGFSFSFLLLFWFFPFQAFFNTLLFFSFKFWLKVGNRVAHNGLVMIES